MDKKTLKITKTESHRKHLKIPIPLYARLVDHVGHGWGETTRFILEAIKEKLDREEANAAAYKELRK